MRCSEVSRPFLIGARAEFDASVVGMSRARKSVREWHDDDSPTRVRKLHSSKSLAPSLATEFSLGEFSCKEFFRLPQVAKREGKSLCCPPTAANQSVAKRILLPKENKQTKERTEKPTKRTEGGDENKPTAAGCGGGGWVESGTNTV